MDYLYGQPVTGGGFRRVDSLDARGHEGLRDSFVVTVSGNYYVTARNNVGESCAPPAPITVYVDGVPTSVDPTPLPKPDPIVDWKLFDARGRKVNDFSASGVYFAKLRRASGKIETPKIPYIRGIGPLVDVSPWYSGRKARWQPPRF
jgi:hypothetical protein